jgi:hypothetical protein
MNDKGQGVADVLTERIKKQAILFVLDNYSDPTAYDFSLIEIAMLIGASITTSVYSEFGV